MKNHMDDINAAGASAKEPSLRASAKKEKLALALRRNLARRKQADSSAPISD